MKTSIYVKNFLSTAFIILLSFVILGGMFFTWSFRLISNEKQRSMSNAAAESVRYLAAQSLYSGFDLTSLDIKMLLSSLSSISGFDILITDLSGTVVTSSDRDLTSPYAGKTVPGDAISALSASPAAKYSRTTTLGGVFPETRYVVGTSLVVTYNGNERVLGYIFLSSESSTMVGIWHEFAVIFVLIAIIVMGVTFIISLITTKKQTEPLGEMARAAFRFARGDFSVRVGPDTREDEIGQLIRAFNNMADSLEHSESLRREFIANVSHELKTPMTSIAGFADGILDGTIPRENEEKYLEIISSETRRLSRLVRSMLDMSQLQATDPAAIANGRFDVSEVIRVTLLSLEGKIEGKKLDAEADLPEEPVVTRGDKDSITQVVYNLIDNAIKFSAGGSTIKLALWKQGGKAYVSVENTGETIPEDEMKMIFDRFHKADRARSRNRDGVGLGLYIVKTILDNHNEDIYVTSGDGITKFVFTLTIV